MSCLVRVSALAYGGALLGEVVEGAPEQIGKRAFVRFAAPQELVRISVDREEKRLIEGSLVEVVEPSTHRVPPLCEYFGTCGGCDLQHIDIVSQRELKRSMVESTLRRQGGITPREGVALSQAELPAFSYRSRITLHLSKEGELGFYRPGTGIVVPIESCKIAAPALNEALRALQTLIVDLKADCGAIVLEQDPTGGVGVLLIPRAGHEGRLQPPPRMAEHFSRVSVRGRAREDNEEPDSLGHFSQVNAIGNAELIKLALEYTTHSDITDLYAGAGNFSIPLGTLGRNVSAVELDSTLVATGRKVAELRGISTVSFVQSSCESYVKRNRLHRSVLLDPPRSGAREVVRLFDPRKTVEVVYVSCNLPTLVRDLKILSERGYEVEKTVVVDMFPQTHHVETVSRLLPR